jgi:hypothetical protein
MKNNTLIEITGRPQYRGYKGYVTGPHDNLPGYFWCRVTKSAPFPTPASNSQPSRKDVVLKPSEVTELPKP